MSQDPGLHGTGALGHCAQRAVGCRRRALARPEGLKNGGWRATHAQWIVPSPCCVPLWCIVLIGCLLPVACWQAVGQAVAPLKVGSAVRQAVSLLELGRRAEVPVRHACMGGGSEVGRVTSHDSVSHAGRRNSLKDADR